MNRLILLAFTFVLWLAVNAYAGTNASEVPINVIHPLEYKPYIGSDTVESRSIRLKSIVIHWGYKDFYMLPEIQEKYKAAILKWPEGASEHYLRKFDSQVAGRYLMADVKYVFENTSDKDATVFMALPEQVQTPKGFMSLPEHVEEFEGYINLRSLQIDGKEVIPRREEASSTLKRKWSEMGGVDIPSFMNVWEVHFLPHEKKTIKTQASVEWGNDSDNPQFYSNNRIIVEPASLWAGTIESAKIQVDLGEESQVIWTLKDGYIISEGFYKGEGNVFLEMNHSGQKVTDNKSLIRWSYEDWEPRKSDNINMYVKGIRVELCEEIFQNLFRDKEYYGGLKVYQVQDVELKWEICDYYDIFRAEFARVLRNEIFARHGRIFKSEDLKEIFESTDWYKPNPDYSDDMLNDMEKRNVQFILDYEKKMGWR